MLRIGTLAVLVASLLAFSSAEQTLQAELACVSTPWVSDRTSFRSLFINSIANALNEPPSRFEIEFPASSVSFSFTLQVLPRITNWANFPAADVGLAVVEIESKLIDQLNDFSSALRTGTVGRYLALPNPSRMNYVDPAAIAVSTSVVNFVLSASHPSSPLPPVNVIVSNTGGADLVVSSISVPASTPWLSVSPTSDFVVPSGQSSTVTVSINTNRLPVTLPQFKVIELHHNVADGAHAIGVSLSYPNSQGGNPGADDGEFGKGFASGAITGVLLLITLIVASYFTVKKLCPNGLCCCRRNRVGSAITSSSVVSANGAGNNTNSQRRPGKDAGFQKLSTNDGSGEDSATSRRLSNDDDVERGTGRYSDSSTTTQSTVPPPPKPSPQAQSGRAAASPQPQGILLSPTPSLRPEEFDSKWQSLMTCDIWGANAAVPLPAESAIETALQSRNILCLASGTLGDVQKFYFFAEEFGSGTLCLVELSLTSSTHRFSALVKSASQPTGAAFAVLFKAALAPFLAQPS